MQRNIGAITASMLDANTIDWSYFVRIDVAAPVGTLRFTDRLNSYTGNIDGTGSQLWSTVDLVVGQLDQARNAANSVSSISFANLDYTWTSRANTPGLRDAAVQVWVGWFDPSTGALVNAVKMYDGKIDNHQCGNRAEFALKPGRASWGRRALTAVPGALCIYPFRDSLTCQYAGADTSCDKTREACTAKGNIARFGGADLMPKDETVIRWTGNR